MTSESDFLGSATITCTILQSLPDLLIVSYESPDKKKVFQGALLDSTNSHLPFGVHPKGGFSSKLFEDNPRDYLLENFPTVQHRHTYYQKTHHHKKEHHNVTSSFPSNGVEASQPTKKLSVRLRARRMLCNRCKSVCTENGENVQPRKKTKKLHHSSSQNDMSKCVKKFRLVPKLKRLKQSEIAQFLFKDNKGVIKIKNHHLKVLKEEEEKVEKQNEMEDKCENSRKPVKIKFLNRQSSSSPSTTNNKVEVAKEESQNMALRKKRSAVGSMEDLWDETFFEEVMANSDSETATPVLKISFGSQGTVLKIPSRKKKKTSSAFLQRRKEESNSAKAAKKALKRAKRKMSPRRGSPFHSVFAACSSPVYEVKKQKKKKKHHRRKKEGEEENFVQVNNVSVNNEDGSSVSYANGDIVWAKYIQDSWWPAKVMEIQVGSLSRAAKFQVDWYNGINEEQQQQPLSSHQIRSFSEFFREIYLTNEHKSDDLESAVKCAVRDMGGQSNNPMVEKLSNSFEESQQQANVLSPRHTIDCLS